MDPHEHPWSEHERVNLLAEILLKAGTSPSRLLFQSIRDSAIQVRWNDLVLPNGRSLGSSRRAFDDLVAHVPPTEYRQPVPTSNAPIIYPGSREIPQKRPHPESYTPIQPRPTQPTYMAITTQSAYSSATPPMPEPANKKKRGRPPKAVTEMRRQEAHAKGEPYPPPRKSRPSITASNTSHGEGGPSSYAQTPPSASLPGPPGATTPQSTHPPDPATESSSGKKKSKPAPLELASPPRFFGPPASDQGQSQVFSNFTPNSAPFSSSPQKTSESHMSHVQYGALGPSPRQSMGPESRDVRMEGVEETQPRTTTPHSFKDTVGI